MLAGSVGNCCPASTTSRRVERRGGERPPDAGAGRQHLPTAICSVPA
ncbi:hypothetical protein M8494_28760 [Serratia ureilytica]